jgi:hypothetical protein
LPKVEPPTILETKDQNMNWVEKRLAKERSLESGAPGVWNKVRAAIQDACDTYNQSYGSTPERTVKCELENGKRLRIDGRLRLNEGQGYRDADVSVVVSFEQSPPRIAVAEAGPVHAQTLTISSNETSAFIRSEGFDADAISQQILEPLLFPTGKYTHIR